MHLLLGFELALQCFPAENMRSSIANLWSCMPLIAPHIHEFMQVPACAASDARHDQRKRPRQGEDPVVSHMPKALNDTA